MTRRAGHLVRRFFGALRPGPPREYDTRWVATVLSPSELAVWSRMESYDLRHSIEVGRRVQRTLAGTPHADDPRWLSAALLHDVGKLDSGLGVFGRVGATLAGAVAGHEMAKPWSTKRGITRRYGLYLRHDELGETRLRMADARPEAAIWAGAHHSPELWHGLPIPPHVVAALDAADDD